MQGPPTDLIYENLLQFEPEAFKILSRQERRDG